jgi:hypothetical protein
MVADKVADLVTKVGGAFSVVGLLIGAWLFGSTTCTSSLVGGRSCTNFFGEVSVNALGQPNTVALMGTGALVGAVVGAIVGWVVGWLVKQDETR